MLNLKKIAVTGGLSCGKSSVCLFLKELGAYAVSADEIVHQLLSNNTNLGQKVIAMLGPEIVVNGQLDRSAIAKKVFNQPTALQSLEQLLHPAVFQEIENQYQSAKKEKRYSLFVAEIPLLFEAKGEQFFDATLVVMANKEACQKRFMAATGHDEKEYTLRMARQLDPEDKAKRATYVLQNNGNLQELKYAVKELYTKLI